MTNQNLKKISLVISIIGIILLVFLSIYAEPKFKEIGSINKKDLDNYVKISGKIINIEKIHSKDSSFSILRLMDNSDSIDILDYKNTKLSINQEIQIIGKVSEYKNELQVEATKIKNYND
jgi:RecJ-like exonuclease